MTLLGLEYEERTEPFDGASGVVHPILNESVVQFQAQSYKELLPPGGPVRTQILGATNPAVEAQAEKYAAGDSDEAPENGEPHALAEDQPEDLSSRGAQGAQCTDLTCPFQERQRQHLEDDEEDKDGDRQSDRGRAYSRARTGSGRRPPTPRAARSRRD